MTISPLSESAALASQTDAYLCEPDGGLTELSRQCAQSLSSQIEILRQLGIAVRVLAEGAGRACEIASTNALWVEGTARTARDLVAEATAVAAQSQAAAMASPHERVGDEARQFAVLSSANAALSETAKGIERIGQQLDLMALQSSIEAARAESGPAMWSAVLAQIESLSKTLNSIDLPPDLHS